jgi:hypothetical protein
LQRTILITEKELSLILIISTAIMNRNNMIRDSKGRAKAKAAIPMVAATVTMALLLLGLSFFSSNFQPTMAQQQDMNTGGATSSQAGNTTAAGGAGEGESDSLSQIRMHIEAVRTALQNNDTQGAMLHLELADNALGGAGVLEASNMTAMNTTPAGNATTGGNATNMTTAAAGGNQTAAAGGNQTAAAGGNQTAAAGGNQTAAVGNATTGGGTGRGDILGGIF